MKTVSKSAKCFLRYNFFEDVNKKYVWLGQGFSTEIALISACPPDVIIKCIGITLSPQKRHYVLCSCVKFF